MDFLISYPRSGNTFFRYCIEVVSNRPTLPCFSDIYGEPVFAKSSSQIEIKNYSPILAKEHHWEQAEFRFEENTKIILMVRDYNQCISSHIQRRFLKVDFEAMLLEANHYMSLIKHFDNFKGKKKIVYYEDFKKEPIALLQHVLEFLESKKPVLENFEKDFNEHKKRSMSLYHAGNYSKKELTKHQTQLLKEKLQILDNSLYEKYLSRY